jgi:hypothetical protein
MVDPNNPAPPSPMASALNNWAQNPLGQQQYLQWMQNHQKMQQPPGQQQQSNQGPPTWATGGGGALTDIATALINKYKNGQMPPNQQPGAPMNILPPGQPPQGAAQPSMLNTPPPGSTVPPDMTGIY